MIPVRSAPLKSCRASDELAVAQGRARFRKMMRSIQLDEAARTGPYTPENVPYEVLAVALDFAGQSATETLRAIEADYATLVRSDLAES